MIFLLRLIPSPNKLYSVFCIQSLPTVYYNEDGAKDITRVFYTTTKKQLVCLDDAVFEKAPAPLSSRPSALSTPLSSRPSEARGEISEEPIRINSGYRSPQLNKKIGGVASSNHLTGCAVDIRVENMEQLIRYAAILLDYADESHQEFDELLVERNRFGAIWLHFAVHFRGNRHKVLFINA